LKAVVQLEGLAGWLEVRVAGKNRFEPRDPVEALAGFAVGNSL
jgi:hypothetical protein